MTQIKIPGNTCVVFALVCAPGFCGPLDDVQWFLRTHNYTCRWCAIIAGTIITEIM